MHSGLRAMRFPPSTYPSASGVDVFFFLLHTSCTECCDDFGFGDQGLNLNDTHYDMYERAVTFEGPDFHSEASHILALRHALHLHHFAPEVHAAVG